MPLTKTRTKQTAKQQMERNPAYQDRRWRLRQQYTESESWFFGKVNTLSYSSSQDDQIKEEPN